MPACGDPSSSQHLCLHCYSFSVSQQPRGRFCLLTFRDTLAEGGRDVHKKKRDLRRANVGDGFEEEKTGVVLGCAALIPLCSEF